MWYAGKAAYHTVTYRVTYTRGRIDTSDSPDYDDDDDDDDDNIY